MDFFLFFSRCADLTPNPPMRYAVSPTMCTFVRASDLASALGVTVKTLRVWIAMGKIPPPAIVSALELVTDLAGFRDALDRLLAASGNRLVLEVEPTTGAPTLEAVRRRPRPQHHRGPARRGPRQLHPRPGHRGGVRVANSVRVRMRVGETLLKPGQYLFKHTMEGDDHVVAFTTTTGNEVARVKCKLEPLDKKAKETAIHTSPGSGGERILTAVQVQGENAKHIL